MNKVHFSLNGDVTVECDLGIKVILDRHSNGITFSFETKETVETGVSKDRRLAVVKFQHSGDRGTKINCIGALREATRVGNSLGPKDDFKIMSLKDAKKMVEESVIYPQEFYCASLAQAMEFVETLTKDLGCTASTGMDG